MQQSQDQKNCQLSKYALIFFVCTRIIAFIFSFPCLTDVFHYLNYFDKIWVEGLQPYSQFDFEYPPLTLIIISFPRIFVKTISEKEYYYALFALAAFLTDCICLKSCQLYCKNSLKMSKERIAHMTIFYALFGLLLFRILYHRLDIVVSLFFTLSLITFNYRNAKIKTSFIINNLFGFFYKLVPVIVLPVAIIFKASASSSNKIEAIKRILLHLSIFILLVIGVIFILEIYSKHSFIENMLFHQKRGIQIESTYASLLVFKNLILNKTSIILHNYGSWNISSNIFFNIVAKYLGHLILILFYIALLFSLIKKPNYTISEEKFLDAMLVTILLFLSFQRILSTQFFIWLIPISSIWLAKNYSLQYFLVFLFLFFATFFIFSINYGALINEEPILVTTLFLRNLVLITFSCFLAIRFFKNNKDQ